MNIHWLQHVTFEGLGSIAHWVESRGHQLTCTKLFAGENLPDFSEVDLLIVMGGPMSIHDHQLYPWLVDEKKFLRHCVSLNRPILGICLGAQLLADALGGVVAPHHEKEIGWFDIMSQHPLPPGLSKVLPERLEVLHWHGDTFTLPAEAVLLYSSEVCRNQAFLAGTRYLGLQFHLEIESDDLFQLVGNCRNELVEGGKSGSRWVQSENRLLAGSGNRTSRKNLLFDFLDYLALQSLAENTK